MHAPKISVVMTVYDGERFVAEAVQSILDQTYTDFEFIIVDNHSTDGTLSILDGFTDDRMKIIRNPENLGQTRALNIGVRQSRGELIARMDADDVALPTRFERQVGFLERNPEIVVVGSWARFVDGRGRYVRPFEAPCETSKVVLYMAGSPELSYGCTLHPTIMLRRGAFDVAGYYDEENSDKRGYPQDYELWSRMIRMGIAFANIGEYLLNYRVLGDSQSRANTAKVATYRLSISLDKIGYYCPGLQPDEAKDLANMLEFKPLQSASSGENVFRLFDKYFDRYSQHAGIAENVEHVRNRIKLYYLPVLFATNKRLCIVRYLALVWRHPEFLFELKFYRKAMKVLLQRSQQTHEGFRPKNW